MQTIGLTGLLQIDLPDHTVRLCDGGFIIIDGNVFQSSDELFGTIGGVDAVTEGATESVPVLDLTLLPPEESEPGDIAQPGFQRSRVRFWIAEYSPYDGVPIGDPIQVYDGQIDQSTLRETKEERAVEMSVVSNLERLFTRNRGNGLNSRFHKSVWPGETGHDNATGLGVPVAWGTTTQGGGSSATQGGYSSNGGQVGIFRGTGSVYDYG